MKFAFSVIILIHIHCVQFSTSDQAVLMEDPLLPFVCTCQWPKAGDSALASFQHEWKAGCSSVCPQTHLRGFLLSFAWILIFWRLVRAAGWAGVEGKVDFKVQQCKKLPSGKGKLEETTFLPCSWCCHRSGLCEKNALFVRTLELGCYSRQVLLHKSVYTSGGAILLLVKLQKRGTFHL